MPLLEPRASNQRDGACRIALINMPFAAVQLPSIALTQLRAVLRQSSAARIDPDIHYLNHDFVHYFGRERYERITESVKLTVAGFGDWLFRQAAFPDSPSNDAEYLGRYSTTLASDRDLLESHELIRSNLESFLDELIERYALDHYDIVGFTSMFVQNTASFAMARRLKERARGIVTVMGGANCETSMGSMIARNVECIDYVFSGPALKTFPNLVQLLTNDEADRCDEITGVFSRKKVGCSFNQTMTEIGEELDINADIPLDYDDFLSSLSEKCPEAVPSLLFETSRGCWWGERSHCTFCGLNGNSMQYRAMSSKKALAQFDSLFDYYPRVSHFKSVDNILPRSYVKDVFPLLETPPDASIFYEIKADLKEHEVEVLAKAGVTKVQPGIEALDTSVLKLMKKGTNSFQNLRFLKSCVIWQIEPNWNLLVGFPGESEDVYSKYIRNIPLLAHLPPPGGVYPVRFDRFSPYHTLAKSYGLDLKPYDFYSMVYPFPGEDLEDFAYFLADHNFENAYVGAVARWIRTLEELVGRWRTAWERGEARPRLTLEWSGESRVVHDSRGTRPLEHDVGDTAVEILCALSRPQKLERLAASFARLGETELERQIASLRSLGLVFEEDEKAMSLVVDFGRDQGTL